jgi:hypothetical protein
MSDNEQNEQNEFNTFQEAYQKGREDFKHEFSREIERLKLTSNESPNVEPFKKKVLNQVQRALELFS